MVAAQDTSSASYTTHQPRPHLLKIVTGNQFLKIAHCMGRVTVLLTLMRKNKDNEAEKGQISNALQLSDVFPISHLLNLSGSIFMCFVI